MEVEDISPSHCVSGVERVHLKLADSEVITWLAYASGNLFLMDIVAHYFGIRDRSARLGVRAVEVRLLSHLLERLRCHAHTERLVDTNPSNNSSQQPYQY